MSDEFDKLWNEYVERNRKISEMLGFESHAENQDKERTRELWEDGRIEFIGSHPVVVSNTIKSE